MNITLLTNELRYTCGVTNHLLQLSNGLSKIKGNKVSIICGGGNGLNRFTNPDIEVIGDKRFLHDNRSLSSYTSAITFLVKYIIKNKIEILHSHSHYTANIAKNASKITRTETIQTNHGLLKPDGRLKHFNAGRYVAINEHIYEYIIKNKIAPKQKISFIRCGIPIPPLMPVKNNSKFKILAASRFVKEKGLYIFIKAVSKLHNDIKAKAEFFIAGEGELKTELLKLNKELGANISFLGSVKDMYGLLSTVNILVYSSTSDWEGFPAVITEAGANGALIISSSFKGVSSVIENNKDGILYKTGDYEDLVKKLSFVIDKYDRYASFPVKFYEKVCELFPLQKMIDKHVELYKTYLR